MYHPSLDEAKRLARRGNLVPVYREITADLETPVSAYLKVARGPYSFLLESVEGGERVARYSFIGTEPRKVIRTGAGGAPTRRGRQPQTTADGVPIEDHGSTDPLKPVEEALAACRPVPVEGLPRFHGGAVGYLAYEAVRHFERLPAPAPDPNGLPEAILMLTDTILVFDHVQHKIKVVANARLDGNVEGAYAEAVARIDQVLDRLAQPLDRLAPAPPGERAASPVQSNMTQAQYQAMVARAKEYIVAGDIIQTVVSQRLSRRTEAHHFDLYRALRTVNPSPYMFYLDLDDFHLVGASPETQVRVEDGTVAVGCIAGTRPRGATEAEDLAMEQELRSSPKERAEHVMLVDLARNDLGRVSQVGSVQVNALMMVERYSHVMHLVSYVTGRLREGMTCFDAFRSGSPLGTVSGAPKIRAMEIIAELEPHQRGPYAGAVGYFDFSGNMDTCVALRTLVLKDGVAYVQAGGGIVYDSVPETEYQETLHKAAALLRAIDVAESMDHLAGPLLRQREVVRQWGY
jgi:anthranilate synthase component 1